MLGVRVIPAIRKLEKEWNKRVSVGWMPFWVIKFELACRTC